MLTILASVWGIQKPTLSKIWKTKIQKNLNYDYVELCTWQDKLEFCFFLFQLQFQQFIIPEHIHTIKEYSLYKKYTLLFAQLCPWIFSVLNPLGLVQCTGLREERERDKVLDVKPFILHKYANSLTNKLWDSLDYREKVDKGDTKEIFSLHSSGISSFVGTI